MIKKKITYDEIWQLSEKVAEKLIKHNYDVKALLLRIYLASVDF